jgi:hypothetical protein
MDRAEENIEQLETGNVVRMEVKKYMRKTGDS